MKVDKLGLFDHRFPPTGWARYFYLFGAVGGPALTEACLAQIHSKALKRGLKTLVK